MPAKKNAYVTGDRFMGYRIVVRACEATREFQQFPSIHFTTYRAAQDIANAINAHVGAAKMKSNQISRFAVFAFGATFTSETHRLTFPHAREYARGLPGSGLVWLYLPKSRHWSIVANYRDGSVWNGQSQTVPAAQNPAEDWTALAQR